MVERRGRRLWNMWGHEGTPWSRRITGADGPHKLRLEISMPSAGTVEIFVSKDFRDIAVSGLLSETDRA
jgi:hypothetical protein